MAHTGVTNWGDIGGSEKENGSHYVMVYADTIRILENQMERGHGTWGCIGAMGP